MKASAAGGWTVEETIRDCVDVISTFVSLKTDCVGCRLARFCTLEEVSRWYGIPLDTLLARLWNPPAAPSTKE